MQTMLDLNSPLKRAENTALSPLKAVRKRRFRNRIPLTIIQSKSVRKPWHKFYKVYKNDTAVKEVLVNDLKPFNPTAQLIKAACVQHTRENPAFCLPPDEFMYRGFLSQIKTMEYAKAGALKYINKLIDVAGEGNAALMAYRMAHYEDLNINLTDRNIRKVEIALGEW